jgi:CBS domain-containing protein
MKVWEVMSRPAIFLRPQAPAHAAARLLASHGFTAAPVVDDDERVVGIATEADLVRGRLVPEGGKGEEQHEPTVADIMTEAPTVGRAGDDLTDVVSLMLAAGIRSMPIVDDDDQLVGVLSRCDVLQWVARGRLISEDMWRRRERIASHYPGVD